jgi:DNA-binding MarR family transcriptional regulator
MTYQTQYTEDMILNAMTDQPELAIEIARRVGCSGVTIVRMMAKLEKAGKVQKHPVWGNISSYSKVL